MNVIRPDLELIGLRMKKNKILTVFGYSKSAAC